MIRIPVSSLKPYWNEHLDQLKQDSMFWHSLWQSAGRPRSGSLFHIQRSCKAKFKSGVRAAYLNYESRYDDVLVDNILRKKTHRLLESLEC